MSTPYVYSIINDFPQAQVHSDLLTIEIQNSTIAETLDFIETSGDNCTIWFVNALTLGDEATLDAVVAAHAPDGAPPSVVNLSSNVIVDTVWATFKQYLDGTIADLYFYTQTYADRYVITSDYHGGFRHQYTLPFSDVADKSDYDTNFAPNQDSRRPYEQLALTAKDSTITYLPSGDIDKIETIIGAKKKVDQYNYTSGDLTSITTTIVDV